MPKERIQTEKKNNEKNQPRNIFKGPILYRKKEYIKQKNLEHKIPTVYRSFLPPQLIKRPDEAIEYYNRAWNIEQTGDFKAAIGLYDEAIKIDPTYSKAFNNRGNLKFRLEKYEEALEDIRNAVYHNPTDWVALNSLGFTQKKLGNLQEALETLTKAIDCFNKNMSYPNIRFPQPFHNRGAVYVMLGEYEKAIEDFETALEICPNSDADEDLAQAKLMLNRKTEIKKEPLEKQIPKLVPK